MTTGRLMKGLTALSLAGVAVFGFQAPALAQTFCEQYPNDPSCSEGVSDSTAEPGQPLTATTAPDSFTPGSPVEVGVESTYQRVGSTTAAQNGSANLTFTVPTNLSPGRHHVVFSGVRNGVPNQERIPFTVVGSQATGAAKSASRLPRTGDDTLIPLTLVGLSLIALGTATVVAARRRRDEMSPLGTA